MTEKVVENRTQTIRFTAELLKGVALLAATKEPREYLNGVLVEARLHETRLVASNGHKLGIVRWRIENEVDGDMSLIIPHAVLRQIKVRAKPGLLTEVVIDGGQHYLRIPEQGLQYAFKPVDGKYIDYARAVPAQLSGVAAHFDPHDLMDFAKCAQALKGKPVIPRITPNADKAALVTIDGYGDFVGVVMPYQFRKAGNLEEINWLKTVHLSAPGKQDHATALNATRGRNRPALAAAR